MSRSRFESWSCVQVSWTSERSFALTSTLPPLASHAAALMRIELAAF